jgi:hypothetical protein
MFCHGVSEIFDAKAQRGKEVKSIKVFAPFFSLRPLRQN